MSPLTPLPGAVPDYCEPNLPVTGAPTALIATIALVILSAGIVAVFMARKRYRAVAASSLALLVLAGLTLPHTAAHASDDVTKPCPPGYHYVAQKDPANKTPGATTPGEDQPTSPESPNTHSTPSTPAPSADPTAPPSIDEPTTTAEPAGTENARIVSDTNRDGIANVEDDSDLENNAATIHSGAVFLANIDDSSGRCPLKDGDRLLGVEEMKDCSDANDSEVNGAEDEKDLAPLATTPLPDISRTASATISTDEKARDRVNIFLKENDSWKLLTADTVITADQLRAGITLGLEGTDVVKDASWDGSVTVTLTITDGEASKQVQATLHSAPLLAHNHTQEIETLFTLTDKGGYYNGKLATALESLAQANGTRAQRFEPSADQWVQDLFEPMYQSLPTVEGTRTMRVMLKSDQVRGVYEDEYADGGVDDADKVGIYQALYGLRGPGVAVLNIGDSTVANTLDSSGNIETLPPMPGYPAGRIVIGHRTATNMPKDVDESEPLEPSAAVRGFFEAQGAQKPIYLDTSFLAVGHIDEFMTTVPADNAWGWKLVVASPKDGLDLVKKLQDEGHGAQSLISAPGGQGTTIDMALEGGHAERLNLNAERIINENIATVKREIGIPDDYIVRVPMFYRAELDDDGPDGVNFDGDYYAADFIPNPINGVVMKNREFIAPKTWGPVIDGTDVFEQAVTNAFAKAGMTTTYVNTYEVLYVHGGEVHCGTNALRTPVPYYLAR
ncbi:MAG: protein-arginine deiminase family protein [Actinomycetaceae bacterium]|nr:protein-arginine deiminase family protein [Actinomycetaceae bacterium]